MSGNFAICHKCKNLARWSYYFSAYLCGCGHRFFTNETIDEPITKTCYRVKKIIEKPKKCPFDYSNSSVIEGYYKDNNFIEVEELPVVHIGDMVGFKYGKKGKVYRVVGVRHYFEEKADGVTYHWMSIRVKGSKKYVQGNWVLP